MMKNPENDVNDRIGRSFRDRSQDLIVEPLPQRWLDLIRYLDQREREQLLREAAKAVPHPLDKKVPKFVILLLVLAPLLCVLILIGEPTLSRAAAAAAMIGLGVAATVLVMWVVVDVVRHVRRFLSRPW